MPVKTETQYCRAFKVIKDILYSKEEDGKREDLMAKQNPEGNIREDRKPFFLSSYFDPPPPLSCQLALAYSGCTCFTAKRNTTRGKEGSVEGGRWKGGWGFGANRTVKQE